MGWNEYESNMLNKLDSFQLDEINQGIEELEHKIDKTLLGSSFKEKLTILYILQSHAKRKIVCREIHLLKEQIFNELIQRTDSKTARVKTFNTWTKYQNQLKGVEFVRDGLKYEFEQLQLVEVSE